MTKSHDDPSHGDPALEKQKFEALFYGSASPLAFFKGPTLIYEIFNSKYEALVPKRELKGRPLLDAIPELKDSEFPAIMKKVFETGIPVLTNEELAPIQNPMTGEIEQRYFDSAISQITDGANNPYGVFVQVTEVTDRVRTRETIQNQNIWLEEVLNRLPIGLIMAEPGTANYRFSNKAAQAMLGQAPQDERVDLSPEKLIVRDLEERILSVDETPSARAARGEELVNEVIILDKGQSRTFVSCSSNIIPAMPGHSPIVLVPFLDISDLKAKELELKNAVMNLEQERDLRERFIAALTHDLRTPLAAAKMSVQLMDRNIDAITENRKWVKRTESSLNRLDDMIQDLLDVTRIRAGEEIPLALKKCNIFEIARDTLADLVIVHGDRFIIRGEDNIYGYWDNNAIRRVIENLATNAVKYGAPSSPVTIHINQNNENVEFSVHNLGNPIPAEDQGGVFQLFKRTRSATQGGQKGWGIGLTLVSGLVKAHGGTSSVSSNAAEGTVFKIILPRDSRAQNIRG